MLKDMEIKIKLKTLNCHITCKICRGYFVDATTVTECLHTFCKSCLVKHLEENNTCPTCNIVIHQSHPLQYISFDRTMQDIVYKLVPDLQANENNREREFYKLRGLPCPKDIPINAGDVEEEKSAADVHAESDYHRQDEQVNVCLECISPNLKTLKRRFIRCSTQATILHLKKFVAKKVLNGMEKYRDIDILCNDELLGKDHTLKFVYVTRWRFQNPPLTLQYRNPRSPVFGHLNASLQGLTTIRAFKAQEILEKEFDNHQDLHSSAWFLFIATSRAFGYWLDLVCIIYITIVTLSFLVFKSEEFGGNVGLAITQSIALTGMFQWGMRQSTELENQMTSVERVLEYSNLTSERSLESSPDKKPPASWPENGKIQFQGVFLKYAPDEPPVLRNLNFTIEPREKIGIVGRTGAGKSSLIAALFQLTETDGQIIIDGRDIREIGLHDLRSKVSIIPQEPVLFSGTMRKNLDPFDEYSDEVLWKALEEVELKQAVVDLPGGLNSKMSEGGTNFSVGQRQLVCLARAIVRNNKILVLDEATANVDPQTDTLIQQTIRSKFEDCSVLTIAHRLNTVMDSDKVLVMDAGTMVEFNHPHLLLQNKNGFLYKMVQQTGQSMSDNLTRIAEENYKVNHSTKNKNV